MMKPKIRGWKEGILTQDIKSVGGTMHKKGSIVRYRRHKSLDDEGYWNHEYEWHYLDQNNFNLVRECGLWVEEIPKIENKPDYCHAWTSKVDDTVMCNRLPCCGFCMSPSMHAAILKEKSFIPEKHGSKRIQKADD